MFRRIGFVPKRDFFATFPKTRPSRLCFCGVSPAAISIHAEQCASIWATFIAPHCRSLLGLKDAIRLLILFET